MRYGKHVNPAQTPQNKPIPGREGEMVQNAAGGYVFKTGNWQQLDRFLILGTEGGTYYTGEATLTVQNTTNVVDCIREDGIRTVNRVVEISEAGRAIKNDPAIFVLALAMKEGNEATRREAYATIGKVCRTGTHLFTLAQALDDLGKGWGRGLKRAIASWYLDRGADNTAHQLAKYQSRNGWSNADLLRLSHPKTEDVSLNAAFKWAVDGIQTDGLPQILVGFEKAKKAASKKEIINLIKEYNLPRECIPTQYLNEAAVWEALLPKMPMTALIRNLGNMSKCGLLTGTSDAMVEVVKKLKDADYIRKSRVHPITVLLALKTYANGCGFRGGNTWTVVPQIVAALNDAFYGAFANVEATGQKFFLGIDVSGSMGSTINNTNLTCAEAAAAIAMVVMRTEPRFWCYGFCDKLVDLTLTPSMSLEDVLTKTRKNNFGSTDCAAAINYARANKLDVDVFVIITDNDTWAGYNNHPSQALEAYRKEMNKPNAKMLVLATAGNCHTIADPKDPRQLDVSGFDASVPQAISEFVKM